MTDDEPKIAPKLHDDCTIAMRAVAMDDLNLNDFKFYVGFTEPGGAWLQVCFMARDNALPGVMPREQGGRKWKLSEHMTKSEVVRTMFIAVMTAIEHETRELFTYRGEAIFGPHVDVDALVEHARTLDKRQENINGQS